MTKILLIEADPDRAAALAAALGGGGAEVRIAPDGFYALTMMERERPDLIVAGGCVGGIGAGELGAIVRSDPTLAGVRLARYTDPAAPPADLNGGGAYDLVLDATAPAWELAEGLRWLAGMPAAAVPQGKSADPGAAADAALRAAAAAGAPLAAGTAADSGAAADPGAAAHPSAAAAGARRDERSLPHPAPFLPSGYSTAEMPAPGVLAARPAPAPPVPASTVLASAAPAHAAPASTAPVSPAAGSSAPAATQPPPRPQAAPDLSGSLGVLDLMELSQAFSLASKTGQLFLDCSRGEGCIYFELGRVIHATIRERTGREAFSEILQATLREQNIAFRFAPREPDELAAVPRSIDLTVQHLLLSFAVDFDETQVP